MICPKCHGKGMLVEQVMFGQGQDPPVELTEIGPCPHCFAGQTHCCEGDREQAMIEATEAKPNEP